MELPKDDEEIALEKFVFGDEEGLAANLRKVDSLYDASGSEFEDESSVASGSDEESDLDGVQDEELFFIDDGKSAQSDALDTEMAEGDGSDTENTSTDEEVEAAWHDSDDERVAVDLTGSDRLKKLRKQPSDTRVKGAAYVGRLRAQFEKIYPRPGWADEMESDNEEQADSEQEAAHTQNDTNAILAALASSQQFTQTKQLRLILPHKILVTRLKNANHSRPSRAAIQAVCFHETHPLLLTGGFDRTLRLYHVDGRTNPFVTSLFLKNSPVSACAFAGSHVYAAGRRRYMNKWDIQTGLVEKISRMYGREQFQKSMEHFKVSPAKKYIGMAGSSGWCNLLSGETGQWVGGCKIEGTVADFEFSHDDTLLVVASAAGTIWEYDLQREAVVRKWDDEGGVGVTRIKLGGPGDRWMAVGSSNGMVNLYDRASSATAPPKPYKTVDNLVTPVSLVAFSPDGQLLCIALRAKRDALRVVHTAQGSVYANWPTSGTPLGKVTAVAFAPDNHMLAIGNEGGKVTLWGLNHYG